MRHFCIRAGLVVLACLAGVAAQAEPSIHAITGVLEGHQVGGVAVDKVGDLYVADFADVVWKITPDGVRRPWGAGYYGASGNAIDADGNLLQSSFYGNFITTLDRTGRATMLASAALNGPVGIAVDKASGDAFVASCGGNAVMRVSKQHRVSLFATSPLFRCPNGITFDGTDTLYVVNFRDNRMMKVARTGVVTLFTMVSDKGLGHVCFRDGHFYVTAYASHALYEVASDGKARRILGNGERGEVDGPASRARLSFPNGIACDPWAPRLYINEYLAASSEGVPRRAIVREIDLDGH